MSASIRRASQSSAADPAGPFARTGDSFTWASAVETGDAILIIDDEPSVADALRLILEDQGRRVLVAGTGIAGLDLARRGRLCLVITDLRLPDFSGLEVLYALRAEQPRLPVVVITSHAAPDILAEARLAGAAAVLPKPFSPSEIISLVERLAPEAGDGLP